MFTNIMEQNIVIYIGTYKALGLIVGIVSGAWYASRHFTKIETRIDNVEGRLNSLEGRFDRSFSGFSPLALLPKGWAILKKSGLQGYIDENKEYLLDRCHKDSNNLNPYDMQAAAFRMFDSIDFGKALEKRMKTVAYYQGVDIGVVRRIGSIYFRDILLETAGFTPRDCAPPNVTARSAP